MNIVNLTKGSQDGTHEFDEPTINLANPIEVIVVQF
jgi:hypothetical protein